MSMMSYTNLINETMEMYQKGDYLEAYDFITENSSEVQGNEAQIYNFRYSLASKAEVYDTAIELMKEAIIEKGYWYSYSYLTADDDLEPLKQYEEFNELAGICKLRESEAKENAKPDLKVITPEHSDEHDRLPLAIALHGNQENILLTEQYWDSPVLDNYRIALPQSSQIEFSGGFSWDNLEKGSRELAEHYKNMIETYEVDSDNILIGGFSAGARVALYAVINDMIEVNGLMFVAPWLPDIDEWEPLLHKLKAAGIKAYVICGEKDQDCLENTMKFIDLLNRHDIPNIYRVVEDLDHEYPEPFDADLQNMIGFIKNI